MRSLALWRSVSYNVNHKVCEYFSQKWYDNISSPVGSAGIGRNKLRTYATFKSSLLTETYVRVVSNRKHRSAMAKFRMEVAPIRLETSRYEGLSVEDRLCPLCELEPESEEHVLLKCVYYCDIRDYLLNMLNESNINFEDLLPGDKLTVILSHPMFVKDCAKTCHEILQKRRILLYNNVN